MARARQSLLSLIVSQCRVRDHSVLACLLMTQGEVRYCLVNFLDRAYSAWQNRCGTIAHVVDHAVGINA